MKRVLAVGIVAVVLFAFQASGIHADAIPPDLLQGSRTTSNGLNYTGSWANFWIEWTILEPGLGTGQSGYEEYYRYTYSLHNAENYSGWILEVSPFITTTNLSTYIISPNPVVGDGPALWTAGGGEGNSPPRDIYGLHFGQTPNVPITGETWGYIFTFLSPQEPVWGDFWARDGQNPVWTAWNVNIGTDPGTGTTNFTPWIATPDTGSGGQIPEPSSLLLLTLGGCGVLFSRLRRKP